MKWDMIHPAYKGGDGELLWQIYYGDFSDDDRFDEFRKKEMWDVNEIRMVLSSDAKFGAAVVASPPSVFMDYSSSSYALWIVSGVVLLLAVLSFCFKISQTGKAEYQPLLPQASRSHALQTYT